MASDYAVIRRHISSTSCLASRTSKNESLNPEGFMLPRGPHDSRTFQTKTGKARFTVNSPDAIEAPDGYLILQTLRSHDQFNTTIYGLDDRYRGIHGGRHVVFLNPDDMEEQGLHDGDYVDLISIWSDGERRAEAFSSRRI